MCQVCEIWNVCKFTFISESFMLVADHQKSDHNKQIMQSTLEFAPGRKAKVAYLGI